MPRAPRPCATHGCPREATDRGRCREHYLARRRASDQGRPTAHQRGYTAAWSRTRDAYLATHSTCECDRCGALPIEDRQRSEDVHHVDGLGPLGPKGHDPTNLRALSHEHHSQVTALHQPGGFAG